MDRNLLIREMIINWKDRESGYVLFGGWIESHLFFFSWDREWKILSGKSWMIIGVRLDKIG